MRGTLPESVRVGFDSLRSHPLRTLLSTSGVVIGVLALVASLSIIDGVDRWSRHLIERESSVQDIVLSTKRTVTEDGLTSRVRHAPVLTLADWSSARASIPQVSAALLTVTGPATIGTTGHRRLVRLTASTANLPDFSGVNIETGRFYNDADVYHDAPVVVLGYRLALEMARPRDPSWLVGRTLRLGAGRREVIGVLAPRVGESDLVAFIPLGRRPDFNPGAADQLAPVLRVKATSVESVPAARSALLDWMAERFPTDRAKLDLSVGLERLENTKQAILLTKLIFGFLIALMLAIGGIGIMNVLLASVAERTREIGIRKAVGASGRDILWHFLSESVAIATLGSVVGVVLGVALSASASAVFRRLAGAEIYPVFSGGMFILAAASALAVGLIFGTYPARIASRLTPIQAIQRD